MEQMSNNSNNEAQNKEQEQKHEKLQKRLLAAGVAGAVALIGFTAFKEPREFVGGVANNVSHLIQNHNNNKADNKPLGDYSTWSRKDLEGKGLGLRPYDPKTEKDKLDKNGFERDLNIPEEYDKIPSVIESEEEAGRQLGPILNNRAINNEDDEQKFARLYEFYCNNTQEITSQEGSEIYDDIFTKYKYSTKGQADYLDLLQRQNESYNPICTANGDGTFKVSPFTIWKPTVKLYEYYDSVNTPLYVDKEGNVVGHRSSAHRDSLMSTARYMIYNQGLRFVAVTPGGISGVAYASRPDGALLKLTQVVLPSKDNPNKFDLFIDTLESPDSENKNKDDNIMVDPYTAIQHAVLLRDINKHILPFRVVIHNIDRPLSNLPDEKTGKIELLEVAKKFGIKIEY